MSMSNNIKDFIWWVIPGQLLGVRQPESPQEIEYLKSIGVGGVVTLLDDKDNHDLYNSQGMDFLWLPVKGGTPPTKDQVKSCYDFLMLTNSKKKALAIHCSNGRKRTGTILASMLMSDGMGAEEAIQLIQELNPEAKMSESQIEFLRLTD